jgi:polyphosphate kinase
MTEVEARTVDPSSLTPSRLAPLAADLAAVHEQQTETTVPSEQRYINREVSWLDFNARVLAQAEDERRPLLERARFLAIFTTNLDEFFQVRVAGLKDQVAAGLRAVSPDGRTPGEQLDIIRQRVNELIVRQGHAYEQVCKALTAEKVEVIDLSALSAVERAELDRIFDDRIFPVLTPLAVDPGHPFPYISTLSLSLAVVVADPEGAERRFARVKVPPLLPRFVQVGESARFVPLEQLIAAHLGRLFPGMRIERHDAFRVTRNADLTLEEEEADDLLAAVEVELRRRRFGRAVRLEIDAAMSPEVRELLTRELDLHPHDVYEIPSTPLDMSGLHSLYTIDRPDLKDDPWGPVTSPRFAPKEDETPDLFAAIREQDVLVHHPYESFNTSVEAFIRQASVDRHVLAIKQTLYRTSSDSPIIKSLIRAAERGKQVAVLVEVKARFDEQANVAWARALEQAGVHVVYGLIGLKTHSKTSLVVRQEPDGIRRYVHIGTGNYNPHTALVYEDLGLFSADPDLGADLSDLFNLLTGYSRQTAFRRIILAPTTLRQRIVELIDEEAAVAKAGGRGRIVMKMNSLADPNVTEALYRASRAGVEIDLIVRGICCLRPGVRGLSKRIRVRSLVGRYLEHSRIYAFGDGESRPTRYLMGSADMMPRNLDNRIEVCVQVDDLSAQSRLAEILDTNLRDNRLAWTLGSDGSWTRVPPPDDGEPELDTHRLLQSAAVARSRRRPSD